MKIHRWEDVKYKKMRKTESPVGMNCEYCEKPCDDELDFLYWLSTPQNPAGDGIMRPLHCTKKGQEQFPSCAENWRIRANEAQNKRVTFSARKLCVLFMYYHALSNSDGAKPSKAMARDAERLLDYILTGKQ